MTQSMRSTTGDQVHPSAEEERSTSELTSTGDQLSLIQNSERSNDVRLLPSYNAYQLLIGCKTTRDLLETYQPELLEPTEDNVGIGGLVFAYLLGKKKTKCEILIKEDELIDDNLLFLLEGLRKIIQENRIRGLTQLDHYFEYRKSEFNARIEKFVENRNLKIREKARVRDLALERLLANLLEHCQQPSPVQSDSIPKTNLLQSTKRVIHGTLLKAVNLVYSINGIIENRTAKARSKGSNKRKMVQYLLLI